MANIEKLKSLLFLKKIYQFAKNRNIVNRNTIDNDNIKYSLMGQIYVYKNRKFAMSYEDLYDWVMEYQKSEFVISDLYLCMVLCSPNSYRRTNTTEQENKHLGEYEYMLQKLEELISSYEEFVFNIGD